ncbi:MAG: ABC transporter ATP-binding protein, partial [Promethearchaeota archaeon]
FKITLGRVGKEEPLLDSSDIRKSFSRRNLFLIILSWIAVAVFVIHDALSTILGVGPLGSLLPENSILADFDTSLLGFEWAFFGLIIYAILTRLIVNFLPLGKRPPKQVINDSIIFGAVLAYLIWSLQLIVFELYLYRLFGLLLYSQDIRLLAVVVAALYIAGFLVSMNKKYLPEAIEDDKRLIQEKMRSMEEEALLDKKDDVILKIDDLVTYFYTEEGVVHAVEGVSFEIYEGEVLGLVGETGCGKSVTALSILQLIQSPGKIIGGSIKFEGEDLLKKSISEILTYRGAKITMIFQDPLNSLNPVFTVAKQITEVYLLHKRKELLVEASKYKDKSIHSIAREWSEQLLRDLNIPSPENVVDRYPHELSGGMRQRIQIAMGIAGSPQLLIADEPTTALDVTVQNQILKLMKDLKKKYNTSILFITHDLGIISKMCNRVAVMYSGSIVEYGTTKALFTNPYHPYTKGLLAAIPIEGQEKDLLIIPGMVPNLIYPPSGCRFHPRCPNRFQPCDSVKPKTLEVERNYFVACHLYDPQYNLVKEVVK